MTMHIEQPLELAQLTASEPDRVLGRLAMSAISMTQLAFYCAAVGVTDPIHYDREFARRSGFADAVVNGSLRVAWMAEALAMLVPPGVQVQQLRCAHRGLMLVGAAPRYTVKHRERQALEDGGWRVTCEIVAEVEAEVDAKTDAKVDAKVDAKADAKANARSCDVGQATLLLPARLFEGSDSSGI